MAMQPIKNLERVLVDLLTGDAVGRTGQCHRCVG
jgi:hypothetical protein